MLKKTLNFCFTLLFVALATFMNSCSGGSDSGSTYDTTFLESGVKYIYLKKGDGPQIDSLSHVSTHINLIVGEDTIWSTYDEGEQVFEFDAKRTSLIAGFDEVVMYGREGDRILAIIPPELGYGERGSGDVVPPNATLQFDLNMLKVEEPKTFLSDILYAIYLENGVEEMIASFKELELDTATHVLDMNEWYDLGSRLMRADMHEDAIALWDYKLAENPSIRGYYMKAISLENLDKKDEAIATLNEGLKTATDTTGYAFVQNYLLQLQSN